LTTLKIGELSYRQGSNIFKVAVNWGYLEVGDDKVSILVDTAEKADDIDLERAKAALGRAEQALKSLSQEDVNYAVMEAALQRALVRVQVAGRR
jgi:F-type H+-transporting ATPase subunit epsilon